MYKEHQLLLMFPVTEIDITNQSLIVAVSSGALFVLSACMKDALVIVVPPAVWVAGLLCSAGHQQECQLHDRVEQFMSFILWSFLQ